MVPEQRRNSTLRFFTESENRVKSFFCSVVTRLGVRIRNLFRKNDPGLLTKRIYHDGRVYCRSRSDRGDLHCEKFRVHTGRQPHKISDSNAVDATG